MKRNIWKMLLVFSALLMFAFSGELAAQDNLGLTPETGNIGLEDSVKLTAVLTEGGSGVEGETIYFSLLPGLSGSTVPASDVTDEFGEVEIYYKAATTSGIDTVEAMWVSGEEDPLDTLTDISIITVNPDAGTRINVTPVAKTVVVAQNATIVAEIQDKYGNHVDAADPAQVSFTHSGKGSLGVAGLNATNNIAVAYTTDDSMVVDPADTVTAELLVTGVTDYSLISTIGAAPDSVRLFCKGDPEVVVSDGANNLWILVQLLDQYGNPSGLVDPDEEDCYMVDFEVSAGGGSFNVPGIDRIEVDEDGEGEIEYLSSMTAGVYAVTGTSEGASDDIDVTHVPDVPATIVLTPDSAGIPAGADTTFTASATDQYSNHIDMRLYYGTYAVVIEEVDGLGSIGGEFLEGDSLNWKATYTSHTLAADTAHIKASYGAVEDVVTLFSATPGDFDHFDLEVVEDSSHVSDGDYSESNWVRIEAQDASNIRIWTYTNPDTVTLTLDESAAGPSQVVWYLNPPLIALTPNGFAPDTAAVGLTALIPENSFISGEFKIGITNQIAEIAPVTATDTAGNTGTSPGLTWLPIGLAGFNVQIAGGLTTIHVNDTVDVEVTAIDMFGNVTDSLLPKIVDLSANKTGVVFPGETHLMQTAVTLFPTVATAQCTGLIITVFDLLKPSTNGESDSITVAAAGVGEVPIVSNMSAEFGSGDILYSVAKAGKVEIKVYNKAGMEVGTLVNGVVEPDYYQTSLKGLNLSSDIYFVVMEGPGFTKRIKATLIK